VPWSLMTVGADANLTGKIKVVGSPMVTNDRSRVVTNVCRGRC